MSKLSYYGLLTIILSRGGATLPLGGAVAPAKKKKSPPAYILILIGPPQWCTFGRPPISVQYLNSLPDSSFSCRPFYPLIKQNTTHSPFIFKYSRQPNKTTLYHLFSNSKSEDSEPFLLFLFLLSSCLLCTRHRPLHWLQ